MLNTRALNVGAIGSKTATPNTLGSAAIVCEARMSCRTSMTKYGRSAGTVQAALTVRPRQYRKFKLAIPVEATATCKPTVHRWCPQKLRLTATADVRVRGGTLRYSKVTLAATAAVSCVPRIYHYKYQQVRIECRVETRIDELIVVNQATTERVIRIPRDQRAIRIAASGNSTGV